MLIIDAGHGGKDSGGGTNKDFKEKDMVLQISLYQQKRFEALGVPAKLSRTDDTYLDPTTRTDIVKKSGATYCISNHINAAAATTARGVETIHSIKANGQLAKAIAEAVASEGMPFRRVFLKPGTQDKHLDYYFMHRQTLPVETVIIEYGFATNGEDSKLLQANWERYAEAVVRAFCMYIGHKYSKEGNTVKKSKQRFRDVPESHYFYNDIEWVAENGILAGTPSGDFNPDMPVTRAQLAAILRRMSEKKGGK